MNKRRACDANRCRQILLTDAISKQVQMQKRTPSGVSQTNGLELGIKKLAPAAGQEAKMVEKIIAINFFI